MLGGSLMQQELEKAYNPNPYHCSAHAADVAQTLGVMLANDEFSAELTELEVLAMITAALCHDVGHPGGPPSLICLDRGMAG